MHIRDACSIVVTGPMRQSSCRWIICDHLDTHLIRINLINYGQRQKASEPLGMSVAEFDPLCIFAGILILRLDLEPECGCCACGYGVSFFVRIPYGIDCFITIFFKIRAEAVPLFFVFVYRISCLTFRAAVRIVIRLVVGIFRIILSRTKSISKVYSPDFCSGIILHLNRYHILPAGLHI